MPPVQLLGSGSRALATYSATYVLACVRACLRACVHACLRACLRACVRAGSRGKLVVSASMDVWSVGVICFELLAGRPLFSGEISDKAMLAPHSDAARLVLWNGIADTELAQVWHTSTHAHTGACARAHTQARPRTRTHTHAHAHTHTYACNIHSCSGAFRLYTAAIACCTLARIHARSHARTLAYTHTRRHKHMHDIYIHGRTHTHLPARHA